MSDNTELNSGSGGDVIATDDIGGVKYTRVKITLGDDGSADGDVSGALPMPISGAVNAVEDGTDTVVKVGDDSNKAVRVNVVAGSAGGGAITVVEDGTDTVVKVGDDSNKAVRVNVVAGGAGGGAITVVEDGTDTQVKVGDDGNKAVRVHIVAGGAPDTVTANLGNVADSVGSEGSVTQFSDFRTQSVRVNLAEVALGSNFASDTNADATVTISGQTSNVGVITSVVWSYNSTPTGGGLYIWNGSTFFLEIDITSPGPGFLNFIPPIHGADDEDLVVVLRDGGVDVIGKLTVFYRYRATGSGVE